MKSAEKSAQTLKNFPSSSPEVTTKNNDSQISRQLSGVSASTSCDQKGVPCPGGRRAEARGRDQKGSPRPRSCLGFGSCAQRAGGSFSWPAGGGSACDSQARDPQPATYLLAPQSASVRGDLQIAGGSGCKEVAVRGREEEKGKEGVEPGSWVGRRRARNLSVQPARGERRPPRRRRRGRAGGGADARSSVAAHGAARRWRAACGSAGPGAGPPSPPDPLPNSNWEGRQRTQDAYPKGPHSTLRTEGRPHFPGQAHPRAVCRAAAGVPRLRQDLRLPGSSPKPGCTRRRRAPRLTGGRPRRTRLLTSQPRHLHPAPRLASTPRFPPPRPSFPPSPPGRRANLWL